mmetsp:Transcript_25577/g.40965  ORF Transcript_25577/g.40965 Transcript_25577/m.40965 type:complete len:269 (-) Transcript_25577:227-1033(-)
MAVAAALLISLVAPSVFLLDPRRQVLLLSSDEDLLPSVSPTSTVIGKEDATELANPAKGWLALADREKEPLPDLDLLLKVIFVLVSNVHLSLFHTTQCLVAELAPDSRRVHRQDIPLAEASGLCRGHCAVKLSVHLCSVLILWLSSLPWRGSEHILLLVLEVRSHARWRLWRKLLCPAAKTRVLISWALLEHVLFGEGDLLSQGSKLRRCWTLLEEPWVLLSLELLQLHLVLIHVVLFCGEFRVKELLAQLAPEADALRLEVLRHVPR